MQRIYASLVKRLLGNDYSFRMYVYSALETQCSAERYGWVVVSLIFNFFFPVGVSGHVVVKRVAPGWKIALAWPGDGLPHNRG